MLKKSKILMLCLVLTVLLNTNLYAKTITDIEDEISDIEKEYDKKMQDLSEQQTEYNDLMAQLNQINEDIKVTENQIVETNNEIVQKEAEIKNLREVQIPDMEEKAQISLEFAQDNMNKNLILILLQESITQDHPLEVTYATNQIIEKLNSNLLELKRLILKAAEDEEILKQQKESLEVKQVELDREQEYLEEVKGQISYNIAQTEDEASAAEEELAAKKEQERLYEEAGCGPNDVYGVDCAENEIPESDSGFVRPLTNGCVTNEYGGWNSILGDGQHSGIDLANDEGVSVYTSAPGKVLYAGSTNDGGGNSVVLLHVMGGQNYVTRYAHLSSISVNTGDIVYYGDQVGAIGHTGSADGPHLHFEIEQNSTYVWAALENPRNYINFPEYGACW